MRLLVPITTDHAPLIHAWCDHYREDIEQWYEWPRRVHSGDDAIEFIRSFVAGDRATGIKMWWLGEDDDGFFGYVQMRLRQGGRKAGVPVWVVPELRRNGYGEFMVQRVVTWCEAMGLAPDIVVDPNNEPMNQFAAQLGLPMRTVSEHRDTMTGVSR